MASFEVSCHAPQGRFHIWLEQPSGKSRLSKPVIISGDKSKWQKFKVKNPDGTGVLGIEIANKDAHQHINFRFNLSEGPTGSAGGKLHFDIEERIPGEKPIASMRIRRDDGPTVIAATDTGDPADLKKEFSFLTLT